MREQSQKTYSREALFEAITDNNIDHVKNNIIANNHALIGIADENGEISLYYAALKGRQEIVKFFLDYAPKLAALTNKKGNNALHLAACRGHEETVAFLLDHSPKSAYAINNDGRNALHLAAYNGHKEVVKLLSYSSYKSVYTVDMLGNNALHLAAMNGHKEVVELLLKHPPELAAAVNQAIHNASRFAATKDHKKVAGFLLNHSSKLASIIDTVGECFFHSPPKPAYTVNIYGRNALHLAAMNGHKEVIAFLLKNKPMLVNSIHRFNGRLFNTNCNEDTALLFLALGTSNLRCKDPIKKEKWFESLRLSSERTGRKDAGLLKREVDDFAKSLVQINATRKNIYLGKLPEELNLHIASVNLALKYPGIKTSFLKQENSFYLEMLLERCTKKIVHKLSLKEAMIRTDTSCDDCDELLQKLSDGLSTAVRDDHIKKASDFMASLVVKKACMVNTEPYLQLNDKEANMRANKIAKWTSTILQKQQEKFGGYVFPELRAALMSNMYQVIKAQGITKPAIEKVIKNIFDNVPPSFVEKYTQTPQNKEEGLMKLI